MAKKKKKTQKNLSLIEKGILASRELKVHIPIDATPLQVIHHATAHVRLAGTPGEQDRRKIITDVVTNEIELAKLELKALQDSVS